MSTQQEYSEDAIQAILTANKWMKGDRERAKAELKRGGFGLPPGPGIGKSQPPIEIKDSGDPMADIPGADRPFTLLDLIQADTPTASKRIPRPSEIPHKTGPYDTPLTDKEEREFQTWKEKWAPHDSGFDYDLRGAFKAGATPDPKTGHWKDTWKKPNHPTFSNESQYAKDAPAAAGHWEGPKHDIFVGPTPWSEVDAKFPKGTPEEVRNKARMQYFNSVVRPRVLDPSQMQATYEEFLRRTEKPWTERAEEIGEQIGGKIGDFIVDSAEMAALMAVAGPITGALGETLLGAGKAADIVGKVARGGLAFGAYDALKAKDGDRVAAGLRGAGWGAVTELGLSALFKFSEKAAAKAMEAAAKDKAASEIPLGGMGVEPPSERPPTLGEEAAPPPVTPPTTMGEAAAQILQAQVTDAKAKGFTTGPMVERPGLDGLQVTLRDAEGNATTHVVPRGKHDEFIPLVEETLAKGGAIDGIEYGPASRARAGEFMRHFAEKAEAEEQPWRMTVPEGRAGEVAKQLNKTGLRGTVVDATTVQVGPEAKWYTAQKAKALAEQAAGKEPGELPDEVSKIAMRAGQLRNQIQVSGGPRADHAELHSLLGDLGRRYQLTRAQAGQLALRYFERRAGEASPESADLLFSRYKGRGEPFGVTAGEKPAPGYAEESRLKGFRSALPGSETHEFDVNELTGELRVRPVGTTVRLDMPAEQLGLRGYVQSGPEGPVRYLSQNATQGTMYHESVHDGFMHADLHDSITRLAGGKHTPLVQVGEDIGNGLKRAYPGYRGLDSARIMNEAVTHVMEAIRMGDPDALDEFAAWDTSVDHVLDFANTVAGNAYKESLGLRQTAPIRAFQRRMLDMVRRTGDVAEGLSGGQMMGFTTWYDPEIAGFVMRDGEGRDILRKTAKDVFDKIEEADPSTHFPDVTHPAYFSGIRGPMVPAGMEPIEGSSTPEIPHVPVGLQALASIGRPALDSFSGIQKRLTRLGFDVDFYGPPRDLWSTARDASHVLEAQGAARDAITSGLSEGRQQAIGELLARPDTDWQAMADAHNLDAADLANARAMSEWDEEHFQGGLKRTLATIRQARERSGNLSGIGGDPAVLDAFKSSHLGYSDLNVARVSQWVMRNGFNETIAPDVAKVRELQKMFSKTSSLSKNLETYVLHIQGVPDSSQKFLNDFMDGIETNMNRRRAELNKNLPLEHQVAPVNLKQAWGSLRSLMFVSGLGGRASVMMRDTFQALSGMTAIGPTAWMDGLQRFMTAEGRAEADAAGALFHNQTVGQAFGDITNDVPTGRIAERINRMANTILAPSRITHNIGRNITFLGAKHQALEQIARLRSGAITAAELADETSAWFHDAPEQSHLLALAADPNVTIDEAARQFGLSATEATQFGGPPGMALRTGMGRLLGQYASWPMNHIEFTRKLATRAFDNPKKGVPALALWASMNYGAFEAAKAAGVDVTKWLFQSPAGWVGSPPLEFVQNLYKMPEESEVGRKARHDVLMTPLSLVPMGVEFQDIIRAMDKGDVTIQDILGFKRLKEDTKESDDLESEIIRELGFKPKDFE